MRFDEDLVHDLVSLPDTFRGRIEINVDGPQGLFEWEFNHKKRGKTRGKKALTVSLAEVLAKSTLPYVPS